MLKGKFAKFQALYNDYRSIAVSVNIVKINHDCYGIQCNTVPEDTLIIELGKNADLKLLYKSKEFKQPFYERCKYYKLL